MKKDTLTSIFRDMNCRVENCSGEYELIQILGSTIKRVNMLGKEVGYRWVRNTTCDPYKHALAYVMYYNGKKVFDSFGKATFSNRDDAGTFARAVASIKYRDDLLSLSPADDSFEIEMAKFRLDCTK